MGIDIYNFLSLFNNLEEIRVRVYDFTSERCIFNETSNYFAHSILTSLEETHGLDAYEVMSVDTMYCEDEKRICFEINVEIEEENIDLFEEVR